MRDFQDRDSGPVALLVDGENLSPCHAGVVMAEAMAFGVPMVRRVYGKMDHIARWAEAGFRLMPVRPGKNAADMLLSVDAVSLALKDGFRTVMIASSDADFSYVAEHLRELGHAVIGLGVAKAPAVFRASCTAFVELPRLVEVVTPPPVPAVKIGAQVSDRAVEDLLCHKARQAGKAGLLISHLGSAALNGGFKVSGSPEKTWRNWLTARPKLFRCDPRGPAARFYAAV